MSCRTLLLLPLACFAAATAQAATDPMVGSWKLNPQKSKLVDEMKVTRLDGNKYKFEFGGPQSESIVADGTDQPGLAGTTFAVTPSPESWLVVRKKDGKILIKATWTLLKDGNQLQDDYTEFAPDGKPTHVVYLYDRRGAGEGYAADWVSTSQQIESVYMLEVRPYENDGLTILVPAEGVTTNLILDGKDHPDPGSKTNSVLSTRRVDARTIELTDKRDDQITDKRQIGISEDGKTLTLTIHVPSRTDPNVLVFDRQ